MLFRHFFSAAILTSSAILASASTPVVSVSSPANGSSVGSPVNYVASASSPSCSKGIAAMRIYTAPGVNAYTINANKLDTNINLPKGTYSTIVQAWDNCGGVGKTTVGITVAKINLPPPRFLYATEFKAGRIAEYVVNPLTGSLTATSQGSTWAHFGPVDIASDHLSTHLYVANQGSHDLDAYFINRTSGNLTQVPGSPFALAGTGQRVAVHPAGHFVYASSITTSGGNVTGGDINAFAVQSNGSLVKVPGSPYAGSYSGPIAIDPSGTYLYISGLFGQGAVAAFTIDQITGALTPVPGSPFVTPSYAGCQQFCHPSPSDLQVDASGNYLYAAQNAQDSVAGFKINRANGSLTNLPGSPYAEGMFNTPSNCCSKDPWRLSIDPSERFIYVADDEGNDFTIFKLNKTTGVPTYVASIGNVSNAFLPGLCVPYTVDVDPSGTFVYSLGLTSSGCTFPQGTTDAVIGYSLNQGNGNLLSVPGSPFANPNVHTALTSEEKVLVTP